MSVITMIPLALLSAVLGILLVEIFIWIIKHFDFVLEIVIFSLLLHIVIVALGV